MRHVCMVANRAALLTCITNGGGLGPGHSAVAVDGFVYSFERVVGAWAASASSGWLQMKTRDYLDLNRHRPVVIQELDPARTDATAILEYITVSDSRDVDYLSSGLCSHLAAKAIGAGVGFALDPVGLNSPYRVYSFLKGSGCVAKSYYTFPDGDNYTPINGRKILLNNLYSPECRTRQEYPPILAW